MPEPLSRLFEQLESLGPLPEPEERAAAAPADSAGSRGSGRRRSPRSGGVLPPRDSKASWAVNVRPKNWDDKSKIWCGKIKSLHDARRTSDIVHHYLGCKSIHLLFPGDDLPPPFANPNLRGLHSLEKRMQYVKRIAKGEEHQDERREFMASIKEMVQLLTQADSGDDAGAAAAAAAVEEVPWFGGDERMLPANFPTLNDEDIDDLMMFLDDPSPYWHQSAVQSNACELEFT